jgi:hypothetical protein
MSPKNAFLTKGKREGGAEGGHSIIISKMAGFASTLPNQRSSVRCKPQTLHLRGLIQFSFFFLKKYKFKIILLLNKILIFIFIFIFLVGINIYCILYVLMKGTKRVFINGRERREREKMCHNIGQA